MKEEGLKIKIKAEDKMTEPILNQAKKHIGELIDNWSDSFGVMMNDEAKDDLVGLVLSVYDMIMKEQGVKMQELTDEIYATLKKPVLSDGPKS